MKIFKCVQKGEGGKTHAIPVSAITMKEAASTYASKYCSYMVESRSVGECEVIDVRVYADTGLFLGTVSVELELVMLVTPLGVRENAG